MAWCDIGNNTISGNIPPEIGRLTRLRHLYLQNNSLHGEIPVNLSLCSNLVELWAYKNNLVCVLPRELGLLTKLKYFDFSYNKLIGEIPKSYGNFSSLLEMYLLDNDLEGEIPEEFGKMKSLEIFDEDFNRLSGRIPSSFYNLTPLKVIDVSFNQLEGSLPQRGIFENASVDSFIGNPRICGGIPGLKLANCNFSRLKKINFKLVILVILGILGLVVIVCALFFYRFGRSKRTFPSLDNNLNQLIAMSYQSILKVTNEFSTSNLIGVGSHGYVYKGILETNETLVTLDATTLTQLLLYEYGMGSEASTQGDVYSFGIVLLEILTGKRPTDDMFGGDLNLHDFVRNAMPDGAIEIVDPRLMRRQKMIEGLISLLGVGIDCSM
ncbi:LRR receptor-like serine/threonine-protein kinase EFR [Solanum pennellii]|uniref:LRR receptor-like serine/threonine-protein kinase EFR n=1 Tax=Solanum pennellii TaxID=28526 RepID=A0ABM1UXP6_SOLPN|nr:LRR receptor-like serine/threonine-protein kinase EFR [Solanum pennellii]